MSVGSATGAAGSFGGTAAADAGAAHSNGATVAINVTRTVVAGRTEMGRTEMGRPKTRGTAQLPSRLTVTVKVPEPSVRSPATT